jgi:hypothetical protein
MSRWLADKVSSVLASRTDRRGMLVRSAIVGSALATNPVDYVLRPLTAYAAACQCRGQPCSCGTACCDGYTEFCCSIFGDNSCPGGTVLGGWWKADGTGFCNGPRYYMDCNQTSFACGCACANGSCSHRVTCCTHFRYGQCHQEIAQVGAIVCRVVTCTPPWEVDGTCTTTSATDQATASHDAPCLHNPPPKKEDDVPAAPAIIVDNQGHQWVFVRGTDAALWAQRDAEGWFTLGGGLTSGPDAMGTSDGRILVVARGLDGATWQIARDTAGNWGNWFSLGGLS